MAGAWERRELKRLNRAADTVETVFDNAGWPSNLRLDIQIDGRAGRDLGHRLRALTEAVDADIAAGRQPVAPNDGTIRFVVRQRDEEPPRDHGWARLARITVGQTPTRLDDGRNARATISQPIAGACRRMIRDLVREAKRQLPAYGPGGVFINTGSVVPPNEIEECISEVLDNPANAAVVWAAICGIDAPRLIAWRDGQPFDRRLTTATTSAAG